MARRACPTPRAHRRWSRSVAPVAALPPHLRRHRKRPGTKAARAAAGPTYDYATGLGVGLWDTLVPKLHGVPRLLAAPGSTTGTYVKSSDVPLSVATPSWVAPGDSYRVDDASFSNARCSVSAGA